MGDEDKRFAHVGSDPRFRTMGKQARKVKIDKRFQAMFKDKKFKLKYTVDKRGRPVHTTTNEDLRKFYDLSESESEDSENESQKVVKTKNKKNKEKSTKAKLQKEKLSKSETIRSKKETKKKSPQKKSKQLKSQKEIVQENSEDESTSGIGEEDDEDIEPEIPADVSDEGDEVSDDANADDESDGDDSDEEESDEADSDSESGEAPHIDLARGDGNISSSDEDEAEYEFEEEKFDHKWNEMDKDASEASEISSRLAVCNMDWDRIKAEDLLVLFNSFKPTGGIIKKISIFVSEFGKERLAEEEVKGPKELVEHKKEEFDGDDAEGSAYHMEKLRQYQLNRLKYYYAVMECDSKNTANHIYEQCDGTEYESSSTRIDLRFIPDDMQFEDSPTSEIKDMPDTLSYKPTLFNCKALNQSQVKQLGMTKRELVELTWDETDKKRTEVLMRKFNKDDLEQMDMKDYLASSSSDDEDPYAGIEEADFLKNTEIQEDAKKETKGTNKYKDILSIVKEDKDTVEDGDMEMEITWEPGLKEATEDLVEKKKKKSKQTPWEEFLDKKKEKKQKKKKATKKEVESEDSNVEAEDSGDEELPEGIDLDDPYFKEEMDKMDEDEEQRKSKGEGKKKKKKRKKKNLEENNKEEDKQEQAALSMLMMDEDDDKQHFSLSAIQEREKLEGKKKKRRNKKKIMEQKIQDNFQINVSDPRFASIFENPMYNIDPSAPEYKATKSMDVLAKEKVKRRQESDGYGKAKAASAKTPKRKIDSSKETPARDDSLANLVKSVKVKTKTMQSKKARLK